MQAVGTLLPPLTHLDDAGDQGFLGCFERLILEGGNGIRAAHPPRHRLTVEAAQSAAALALLKQAAITQRGAGLVRAAWQSSTLTRSE